MDTLPAEILAQILIRIDPSTIYNMLQTSKCFVDILDIEQYWKLKLRRETPLQPFGHKTYKWIYKCYLHRKNFVYDLSNTPWEDEQSSKTYIGDDEEGQIIYKGINEKIIEKVTASMQSLRAVEEDQKFTTGDKTGYYAFRKMNGNIYFFRYTPYDALYSGIMFPSGNIFVDFSPLYVGQIKKDEQGDVFRDSEGIAVFRSGYIFLNNYWSDEHIFIANDNPRLAIPVQSIEAVVILDEGLADWMEYCMEKNMDENWARDFSESI